ncbi:hypothetical protein B0H17DRAFT_1125659 [Mycena rosella]|uniref:Uncharacterized protein n=1 Tax=Mycena rosella TaxID=1033263 RepID=A0AAD7GWY1_MYCRO|nr:hypothetical protein B0H17DRAFT_1125659 [Mycena rosella]
MPPASPESVESATREPQHAGAKRKVLVGCVPNQLTIAAPGVQILLDGRGDKTVMKTKRIIMSALCPGGCADQGSFLSVSGPAHLVGSQDRPVAAANGGLLDRARSWEKKIQAGWGNGNGTTGRGLRGVATINNRRARRQRGTVGIFFIRDARGPRHFVRFSVIPVPRLPPPWVASRRAGRDGGHEWPVIRVARRNSRGGRLGQWNIYLQRQGYCDGTRYQAVDSELCCNCSRARAIANFKTCRVKGGAAESSIAQKSRHLKARIRGPLVYTRNFMTVEAAKKGSGGVENSLKGTMINPIPGGFQKQTALNVQCKVEPNELSFECEEIRCSIAQKSRHLKARIRGPLVYTRNFMAVEAVVRATVESGKERSSADRITAADELDCSLLSFHAEGRQRWRRKFAEGNHGSIANIRKPSEQKLALAVGDSKHALLELGH